MGLNPNAPRPTHSFPSPLSSFTAWPNKPRLVSLLQRRRRHVGPIRLPHTLSPSFCLNDRRAPPVSFFSLFQPRPAPLSRSRKFRDPASRRASAPAPVDGRGPRRPDWLLGQPGRELLEAPDPFSPCAAPITVRRHRQMRHGHGCRNGRPTVTSYPYLPPQHPKP